MARGKEGQPPFSALCRSHSITRPSLTTRYFNKKRKKKKVFLGDLFWRGVASALFHDQFIWQAEKKPPKKRKAAINKSGGGVGGVASASDPEPLRIEAANKQKTCYDRGALTIVVFFLILPLNLGA